jgi:SAM-dependent methyltransferase
MMKGITDDPLGPQPEIKMEAFKRRKKKMNNFQKSVCSIILITIVLCFSATGYTQKREPDVIFEPTPQDIVEEMLKMAEVTENDVVYDLGCGDGRFIITAANKYGARGVGVDINPVRVKESTENAIKAGVADRLRIFEGDLFETDIREATVVTLYLLTDLNLKLRPKLLRELRPGSRVVSYSFSMGDWKPDKVGNLPKGTFYYWVIPADVAGSWIWNVSTPKGDRNYTLWLEQKFQEIKGEVSIPEGGKVPITDAKLIGDQLSFTVKYDTPNKQKVVMNFNGRVSGDTINGNMKASGGSFAGDHIWRAKRNP